LFGSHWHGRYLTDNRIPPWNMKVNGAVNLKEDGFISFFKNASIIILRAKPIEKA